MVATHPTGVKTPARAGITGYAGIFHPTQFVTNGDREGKWRGASQRGGSVQYQAIPKSWTSSMRTPELSL